MLDHRSSLSRREFLKYLSANLAGLLQANAIWYGERAGLALPFQWFSANRSAEKINLWPQIHLTEIPTNECSGNEFAGNQFTATIQNILAQVPMLEIDLAGNLILHDAQNKPVGPLPVAQTLWNREHHFPVDRLLPDVPWGIVLHWYGDKENFDRSVTGYLRGFDSLRMVCDILTRTSAHFLVGPGHASIVMPEEAPFGILQTQIPDLDGVPFLASHLQNLDLIAHKNKEQYFVRAYYQLGYKEPAVHSLLQDLFDGRRVDPNLRTIAIEITGYDFDSAHHFPTDQQIANVLGVVWAVMKRYRIPASHLLGHHEIQLNKADPGKKFMAFIRYLLGLLALLRADQELCQLVFGQYLQAGGGSHQAVRKYFQLIRDYLILVSRPRQVYEWELSCGYWRMAEKFMDEPVCGADIFDPPLAGDISANGDQFTIPGNHEAVDLALPGMLESAPVFLSANGTCIFAGVVANSHLGQSVVFRHRQSDGTEVLTIYAHLSKMEDLVVGYSYPRGYILGQIDQEGVHPGFLHFAIAYGAAWETDLKASLAPPSNVGPSWIHQRYLDPGNFLLSHSHPVEGQPVVSPSLTME
jgi:hypothetical protein